MKCPKCKNELIKRDYYTCEICGASYTPSYFVEDQTQLNTNGGNQMSSIGKNAQEYVPPQTANIADLERVSVDLELEEKSGTKKEDGKSFHYNVIIVDGEEYRVPNSVLKQLKVILEEKPDLKNFKVKKTGEGLNTEYQVLMLE